MADARGRLRAAGIPREESDLDARLLAEFALGWTSERFFTSAGQRESDDFAHRYEALVSRRASREPLAYIVGRQEFWGLSFEVSPAVLIPRPETELIVEAALALFPSTDAPVSVADVCTGSGCVAVALARERPAARVVASDVSNVALALARRNASRHGVADRVTTVCTDLLDGIDPPLDLVASNPPYVRERDRLGLQPEVRDHEPALALFAGPEGLDIIRRLVGQAPTRLRPGGYLIFEFGFGQDEAVEELLASSPDFQSIELRRDLQGIARTAVARRR